MRRKLLFWFLYCFYLFAVLFLIDYVFYLFYRVQVIPKSFPSRLYSSITGINNNDKKSSFNNFNKAKKNNIIRIGCFGDSFTHGDEVNDSYDYPTLLQGIFQKNGYDNIEVLNFGIGGIGFHQAFNIWKFIGKEYSLDYVILGPLCFQHERDSTFTVSTEYNIKDNLYPLHARYILKNKGVELIDLNGNSGKERIINYISFIPYVKYLLYDIRPPAFLAAPLYCLLSNREFKRNPFYYRNNLEKEMSEIYKILLNEITTNVPQVILCHYENEIVNIGQSLNKNNMTSFLAYRSINFPYAAAYGHNSSIGNQLLAQQLFDCLIGRTESTLPLIKTATIFKKSIERNQIQKIKLSEYQEIRVEVDHVKLGCFYDTTYPGEKYENGPQCEPLINTFADTSSIIAFQNNDSSILDWVFMSFDFEVNEHIAVTMRLKNNGTVKDIPLGNVKLLHPGLNIGVVDIGTVYSFQDMKILKIAKCALDRRSSFLDTKEVVLLLQGIPILSAKVRKKDKDLEFHSINGHFLVIKADGRKIVDISKLERTGLIYLFLDSGHEESSISIPIAQFIKMDKNVSFGKAIINPITIRVTKD